MHKSGAAVRTICFERYNYVVGNIMCKIVHSNYVRTELTYDMFYALCTLKNLFTNKNTIKKKIFL